MNEGCNSVDYSSEQLAARERLAKMGIKLDYNDLNATAGACEKNLGKTQLYIRNADSTFLDSAPQAPVFDPNVSSAPTFDGNLQKITVNNSGGVDVRGKGAFAQGVNTVGHGAQTNIGSRGY